ncbi:MAG: hypothetical protein ACR2N5_08030, partial [Solirubrobacterales bacterium]
MTSGTRLEDRHIAELHELARELEVPRYRLLGRGELVDAIRERGGDDPDAARRQSGSSEKEKASADRSRSSRRRGGRGRGRSRQKEAAKPSPPDGDDEDDAEGDEDEVTEDVTGVLDVMPRRFGFLRLSGLEAAEGDVYVSASQIRRCELLSGDEVAGPARAARRGERHPALVHVDKVNGSDPAESKRTEFDDLTAVPATRRIGLGSPSTGSSEGDALVRAVDLLAPLAFGQRVLVSAAPGSGRTSL